MGVIELTATHDCCRCIALLDKYYSHRYYQIHFAHAELKSQNIRPCSRASSHLKEMYTQEEVKVKYILNSLYAELQQQPLTDVQNVLANSILEFIWKIADHSIWYTSDVYQRKLQLFEVPQAQQSTFDDFAWALLALLCLENEGCLQTPRSGRGLL